MLQTEESAGGECTHGEEKCQHAVNHGEAAHTDSDQVTK